MLSRERTLEEDRRGVEFRYFKVSWRFGIQFQSAYAILLTMQKLNWGINTRQKLLQTSHQVGVGKFWVGKHSAFVGIDPSNGEEMAWFWCGLESPLLVSPQFCWLCLLSSLRNIRATRFVRCRKFHAGCGPIRPPLSGRDIKTFSLGSISSAQLSLALATMSYQYCPPC